MKLLNQRKILQKYITQEYIDLYVDLKRKELETYQDEISNIEYKWYLNL